MDLSALPRTIWSELALANDDRQHPWRTPVLASIDSDGCPQARTVVLRNVDRHAQTLQFFTDSRSPKVNQLRASPQIQLVFWSKTLNWQVRISATADIATEGLEVDAAWELVKKTPARQDYLSDLAPGDALPLKKKQTLGNNHHLAVITAKVSRIDWLSLSYEGHQRAEISVEKLHWLTP